MNFPIKDDTNNNRFLIFKKSDNETMLHYIYSTNRFIKTPPKPLETLKKWEKLLSHATHMLLYVFMVAVPFSGYLMSNSYGYPAVFFGLELPFLVEKNYEIGKIFSQTHTISAFLLLGLVVIHVLGALKHRFLDDKENDVLKRML